MNSILFIQFTIEYFEKKKGTERERNATMTALVAVMSGIMGGTSLLYQPAFMSYHFVQNA